jgi:hypothetical protein
MNSERTEYGKSVKTFVVTAADGTKHTCEERDFGKTLAACPGWKGFSVVTVRQGMGK